MFHRNKCPRKNQKILFLIRSSLKHNGKFKGD
jgi:hypothetical protein